jgi:hypothetical protein
MFSRRHISVAVAYVVFGSIAANAQALAQQFNGARYVWRTILSGSG